MRLCSLRPEQIYWSKTNIVFRRKRLKRRVVNKPLGSESKQNERKKERENRFEIIKADRLECTVTAKMLIIIIYDLRRIKTERDNIVTATAVSNNNNNNKKKNNNRTTEFD